MCPNRRVEGTVYRTPLSSSDHPAPRNSLVELGKLAAALRTEPLAKASEPVNVYYKCP
jgi:hypothetical protein